MMLPLDLPARATPDVDLRCGDWRNVLADVECDALICDCPYSERTHAGHDAGVSDGSMGARGYREDQWLRADGRIERKWAGERRKIEFPYMTDEDVREFVRSWHPRCRGWFVSITDYVLWPVWAAALEDAGRYVFAPLPMIETGGRVRLSGDGPSSWTCWLCVARPRALPWSRWGTLPGAYVQCAEKKAITGGKPLWLMKALVRDYSRPGDLIADPCAGSGTTLLAARNQGRRAVGAEMDPATFAIAQRRLSKPWTPDLFCVAEDRPTAARLL